MHANILVTPQERIARSWDTLPTHQVGGLKGIAPVRAIHGMLQHACIFEARLLASMRHRHIVPVVDGGWEQETPFFVMSYASKGTFEQYFPQEIPLSVHLILPTVLQMASMLQYVHNHHLVHCDVKPGNMLVGPHNEVWLSDFGIAISLPYAEGSTPHEVRASVIYAAPEQLMGRPVPASDQYALAVMVYHWLCGHYPFLGSSMQICLQHLSTPPLPLRDHIPTISRAIEHMVLKALAKDPHQRFAHVLEFAYALKQANKAKGRTEERRKQAERRRTEVSCQLWVSRACSAVE